MYYLSRVLRLDGRSGRGDDSRVHPEPRVGGPATRTTQPLGLSCHFYRESAASRLERSGLEALTTQPRKLAVATAIERIFMFRGGAVAMAVRWPKNRGAALVSSKPL